MKSKSLCIYGLVGAGLLAGCASPPPSASIMDAKIVPFAKIRDAADSADGYYALGRELQRSGKFEDAERAYRLALEMEPGHFDARNGLAAISVNRGDIDMALSILGSLAAAHPDQPHLLSNLGFVHYLKGSYFDARVALEQAMALDPSNERTREKLLLVLQKLGVSEAEVPLLAGESRLIPEPSSTADPSGVVAVGPGVYQLQAASIVVPLSSTSVVPPPQVQVRVGGGTGTDTQSSEVAELTPPAGALQAAASGLASPKAAKLEIINGNGVARLARNLRQWVQGGDWHVVRIANHPRFNIPKTRIEYARGNRESAEYLARDLQVTPIYRNNDALGDRVRVILGYDFRTVESLPQRVSMNQVADVE